MLQLDNEDEEIGYCLKIKKKTLFSLENVMHVLAKKCKKLCHQIQMFTFKG